MTLGRYLAYRFWMAFIRIFGMFYGIMVLIDMLDQLRRLSGHDVGALKIMVLSVLHVPQNIYTILPLIMLLSSMMFFLALSRSSELVVIRATGQSGLRFLLVPLGVAFLIGVLAVVLFNPLVAATSNAYETLYAQYSGKGGQILSLSGKGLWLRQGGEGQTVIHAQRTNADGTILYRPSFFVFDQGGTARARIEAQKAQLTVGGWDLTAVKKWQLDRPNPEAEAMAVPQMRLPSDLTAALIRDSFGNPAAIAIWGLPTYIANLKNAGFSARKYEVWLQMQLSLPFLMVAMGMVVAGFTMRHARFGKTGVRVLYALLLGFIVFFMRNFTQILGESGQIPVLFAAWAPPVVSMLFAFAYLLHLEEG